MSIVGNTCALWYFGVQITKAIDLHLKNILPNERETQTSHIYIIDCFLSSFCYIKTVFILKWLTAQPSYEVKAAVEVDK
jgi:hypothetical protein